MKEKDPYKEKRKNKALKVDEWLTFFFFPITKSSGLFKTKTFNETEIERFKKFKFEKKIEQSHNARLYGIIFYIISFTLLYKFFG